MSAAADAAQATVRAAIKPQRRVLAEGRATVSAGSSLARVTGIASDPVQIDKSNWFGAFITAVGSAAMSNRRVMVAFVDGQPYIVDVIGV